MSSVTPPAEPVALKVDYDWGGLQCRSDAAIAGHLRPSGFVRRLVWAGRPVCLHGFPVLSRNGVEAARAANRAICAEFDPKAATFSGLHFREFAVALPCIRRFRDLRLQARRANRGEDIRPPEKGTGSGLGDVDARGLGTGCTLPGSEEPCCLRCGLHGGASERHHGVDVFAMKPA